MKITQQDVLHVAHLARLNLSQKELTTMTSQLDDFLHYVDKLQEVTTENITPVTHFFSIENAFRDDKVQPSLREEDVLKNSPKSDGGSFLVPRII